MTALSTVCFKVIRYPAWLETEQDRVFFKNMFENNLSGMTGLNVLSEEGRLDDLCFSWSETKYPNYEIADFFERQRIFEKNIQTDYALKLMTEFTLLIFLKNSDTHTSFEAMFVDNIRTSDKLLRAIGNHTYVSFTATSIHDSKTVVDELSLAKIQVPA